MTDPGPREPLTYAAAGVDLDAREATAKRFGAIARRTHGTRVIDVPGAFASFFALGAGYRDPVLVASTDGLGTKPLLHLAQGTIWLAGHDIVNNNVGDLVTTGASPLFFLDYIATNGLPHEQRLELVDGIAQACEENGVALIGGETADMPDTYREGDFDIAGFVVGVVERDELIDGSTIAPGDALVAIPSNGLMTNGYSLAREVWALGKGLAGHEREVLDRRPEELGGASIGEALTAPHPAFAPLLRPALPRLKGIAHITGGGIPGNLSRILRDDVAARIERSTWDVPGLFALIQREGGIEDAEMFRTFNMGVGMIAVTAPEDLEAVLETIPGSWRVGEVVPRTDGDADGDAGGDEIDRAVRGLPLPSSD